jgi:L-fuconolactonase
VSVALPLGTPATHPQILVGRDEDILDPDIKIIDSHHHLFDRPPLKYMLDEYLADARAGHRIVATVYRETSAFSRANGPEALRPLGEIEFANGIGAIGASGVYGECRVCAGIVGHADLRFGDGIAALLDRALEIAPERFRGVRQVAIDDPNEAPYRFITHRPPRGVLKSASFHEAFRHLVTRGLTFDAAVFHHQLPDVNALADAFPDAVIVLNHCGHAMLMDMDEPRRSEVIAEYRALLSEVARRPNVVCKVGGLGLPFWGFRLEERAEPIGYLELAATWRPFVETAIEAFGPNRCMMESNYPPDGRSAGFVPLWNALKHIVRAASAEEKAALFHDTAARVYRIAPPNSH